MPDTIYIEGIRTFKPHDNAPDFIKASGVIAINPLVQFFKENPSYITEYKGEPQIKFQILDGKNGLYLVVDAYKVRQEPQEVEDNDDLPF